MDEQIRDLIGGTDQIFDWRNTFRLMTFWYKLFISPTMAYKQSSRTSRRGSRLQMVRDICESISLRSHSLFGRPDHRTPQNPYNISNMGAAMTTTRAKLISIVLFVLSMFLGAIVLGVYYMKWWHPNTDKIFKWNAQMNQG